MKEKKENQRDKHAEVVRAGWVPPKMPETNG